MSDVNLATKSDLASLFQELEDAAKHAKIENKENKIQLHRRKTPWERIMKNKMHNIGSPDFRLGKGGLKCFCAAARSPSPKTEHFIVLCQ